MNHYFDVEVATKYNVNIAIFLNNLAHWTVVNIANRNNYYDFRYWTYNSRRAFLELFPYWTDDQLRTIIANAIKADLVIEGNYNQKAYDKTKWYSLSDKALALYNINPISPNSKKDDNPCCDSSGKNPKSSPEPFGENPMGHDRIQNEHKDIKNNKNTLQPAPVLIGGKSPIDVGEIPNGLGKNPQPIPDSKPDEKPTTTTRDQILNKHHHSEPVVVSSTSLTSTPKVKPLNPVNQEEIRLTIELRAIYRTKPFTTPEILCEDDFIDSGLWGMNNRGENTINQRLGGITKLVKEGRYEGEQGWIKLIRNRRNSGIGDINKELQLKASADKAVILTSAKGRDENLREIMEIALKNKKQTTIEPVYKESTLQKNTETLRKVIQFRKLPGQDDFMFQPDPKLLPNEPEIESELLEERY